MSRSAPASTIRRAVTHLASLDVLPTVDMWEVLHGTSAAVGFHLYLMAQPPGLPERMIAAAADDFFGHFLDRGAMTGRRFRTMSGPAICGPAGRGAVHRRGLPGIGGDRCRTRRGGPAGRHHTGMPVTVLQQDWGAALGFDAAQRWRAWAPDLVHESVPYGHFMAEEAPDAVVEAVRSLLLR